jgi:hypothetical protein
MFTIGADPEMFLREKYTNKYKSAVGLITGTKDKPTPIDNLGHAYQVDNVAVEFNIAPADSLPAFRASIHKVLDYLRTKLPDYDFSQESAVSFPEEELQTPEAQLFGCEPDYDAWNMIENSKPNAPDRNLRSCGGHIHVGSPLAIDDPVSVIRALDLHLGVQSVAMDKGVQRRALYGKAGAFRFKPYGAEYRTLSNFWIFDNKLITWAYEGTQRALEFVDKGNKISDKDGHLIQQCINNGDMKSHDYLVAAYKLG